VRRPKAPAGPGTVTRGVQTSGEYGTSIEAGGEWAIVHHFGCSRREPLRSALVPGAVRFQCPECRARVSVGPDGQPVDPKAAPGLAADTPPPEPVTAADGGDLPGGLSWPTIEATYRALAQRVPLPKFRRLRPRVPSRPEVAAADPLNVSPATLRRACVAAGKGSKWPPEGL
jgi:hypothetical protein